MVTQGALTFARGNGETSISEDGDGALFGWKKCEPVGHSPFQSEKGKITKIPSTHMYLSSQYLEFVYQVPTNTGVGLVNRSKKKQNNKIPISVKSEW